MSYWRTHIWMKYIWQNSFLLSFYRQLCENAAHLPLKDNQTANVLVFRRWSEKLRRERGLETAWSANWISPSEMTEEMKCHPRPGRNAKHVNVKSIFFLFSFFFFVCWLFLLYLDVSGINHHSEDEKQPPAAPQETQGQTESCCTASRTAVFKLCVTALTLLRLIPSCGAAAPTNKKQFTRPIRNLEMINANHNPCVFTNNKIVFSFEGCHQKYPSKQY